MANQSFNELLNSDVVKNRFNDLLGKNANGFASDLRNLVNSNDQLKKCEPMTIISAATVAAKLRLSITPTLGQAYIVPKNGKATFQIGARGWIQLAHRTGKYVRLHAGKVFEGQIKDIDFLTGDIIRGEKISNKVVGYIAFMRLTNGFENTVYMTAAEIDQHAEKYSYAYAYDKRNGKKNSPWSTDFDSMACKTVFKKLLSTCGYLSADLEEAIQNDQSVADKNPPAPVDITDSVVDEDAAPVAETSQESIKAVSDADPF